MGEDFMQEGGRRSKVIDDNDGRAEIGWQMPEQARIGVESAGGTTYADQRKVLRQFIRFFASSLIKAMDSEIARDQKHDHDHANDGKYVHFAMP
jgi:hypothetical protein